MAGGIIAEQVAAYGAPQECPRCGSFYDRPGALSRTDNHTRVCPPCGTTEALEDWYEGHPTPQDEWPVSPLWTTVD